MLRSWYRMYGCNCWERKSHASFKSYRVSMHFLRMPHDFLAICKTMTMQICERLAKSYHILSTGHRTTRTAFLLSTYSFLAPSMMRLSIVRNLTTKISCVWCKQGFSHIIATNIFETINFEVLNVPRWTFRPYSSTYTRVKIFLRFERVAIIDTYKGGSRKKI